MLTLLLFAQAIGPSVPPDLAALPSAQLAARIMAAPPQNIVSHQWSRDPLLGRTDSIWFYAAPEAFGEDLCRRRAYHVSFGDVEAETADRKRLTHSEAEQLALVADCAKVRDEQFGWVQPATALDAAAVTLRWLADRQRRGGAQGITCLSSRFSPDPCDRGAAAVLAALPLDRVFLLNRGRQPGDWALGVMPTGPGQLFYDVRLTRGDGQRPGMTIRWDAPAPF